MKKLLLLLAILTFIVSCQNTEKKNLDKNALELENFNFETNRSTILSEKDSIEGDPGYYKLKSETIKADTIFYSISEGMKNTDTPVKIEYHQYGFSQGDYLAKFGDFYFNGINFTTTPDGKMMMMNGFVDKIEQKESEKFIKVLDEKYGKAIKTTGRFFGSFDAYKWELNDRIIRYCTVWDNEENTIKLEESNGTLTFGEKEPHFKALIFIINKKYKNEILGGNSGSGEFVYLDDGP